MTHDSMKNDLAKNLKDLMNDKNLTQKQLSLAINVDQSTISNWLRAKKYPRTDHINELSSFFKVSKTTLIENKSIHTEYKIVHLDGNYTKDEVQKIQEYAELIKKARTKEENNGQH